MSARFRRLPVSVVGPAYFSAPLLWEWDRWPVGRGGLGSAKRLAVAWGWF